MCTGWNPPPQWATLVKAWCVKNVSYQRLKLESCRLRTSVYRRLDPVSNNVEEIGQTLRLSGLYTVPHPRYSRPEVTAWNSRTLESEQPNSTSIHDGKQRKASASLKG